MNMFEQFIYSIVVGKTCLPPEKCPGIKAGRDGKKPEEVCIICGQCWNELNKKQR